MRAVAIVWTLAALGCAQRPPTRVPAELAAALAEPAGACIVRRTSSGETPPSDVYVRPASHEYRYDARGRLVFAIDQTDYLEMRRSWFSYDARDRLARVHRHIDRVVLESLYDVGARGRPSRYNDQDDVDEGYSYDDQNRLVQSIERITRYDHQGGAWHDAPASAERRDGACIDPISCPPPRVRTGGTVRAYSLRARSVTVAYTDGPLPTSSHVSVTEQDLDGRGLLHPPPEDSTTTFAYDVEPHAVTAYVVRDGKRLDEYHVERNGPDRLHEIRFSDGRVWYELIHRVDARGRRLETTRTQGADHMVTTYTYDGRGALTAMHTTRTPDDVSLSSTYEYGVGCTDFPRTFDAPPNADRVDPFELAIEQVTTHL